MSDSNNFGSRKLEFIEFVNLEHGYQFVTVTVFNTWKDDRAWSCQLTPAEAKELASDLVRRASEIEAGLAKERI